MQRISKKLEEIFDAEKLPSRFYRYQRDSSLRGRSLYLSQFLICLRREFPEFKEPLDKVETTIKKIGRTAQNDAEKRIAVIESLRSEASQIYEIAEDTMLEWFEVRKTLLDLLKTGIVRRQLHPLSNDYQEEQWFLN